MCDDIVDDMGCMGSSPIGAGSSADSLLGQAVYDNHSSKSWIKLYDSVVRWQDVAGKSETLGAALTRLDNEIANSEKTQPVARLAVVSKELESLQQEIKAIEEVEPNSLTSKEGYAKAMHQVFVSLDVYRRPVLASENEDYIANVNRKEMRRLELWWLRARREELLRERRALHAQILRARALHAQQVQIVESIWGKSSRPGQPLEASLSRALGLRDALVAASARLKAAAQYAHEASQGVSNALQAWKLAAAGKSGWERTVSCADACSLLVRARCSERGARRVLSAPAAPRAARTLRLALDYAFTDALHDHKYQRATEIFNQFKEALTQLISSIHQVHLTTMENLSSADADVSSLRRSLRAARISALVRQGLGPLHYQPRAMTRLQGADAVCNPGIGPLRSKEKQEWCYK